MWNLSYDVTVNSKSGSNGGDDSLELFAQLLSNFSSRYEEEALLLLKNGHLEKNLDSVTVVHFLRDGGSGYKISNESPDLFEEVFYQKLDDDPDYKLKLLIDQIAQSEVDAQLLTNS